MGVGLPDGGVELERTVILGAARTPFGKFGGALSPLVCARARWGGDPGGDGPLRRRGRGARALHLRHRGAGGGRSDPLPPGQLPRRAPFSLTTETLNQVCASGLRSATLAETLIRAGDYEVVLAGGMESMSNAPYLLPKARWGMRMGDTPAVDAMMHDGLLDAFEHVNMIRFGTDGAKKFDISREEQDEWALRSHQRAAAATDDGKLSEEIVGVKVPGKKGQTTYVDADEPIRRDTTLEKLAELAPIDEGGTVTAGNAPGVTDGAGALVLAGEGFAERRGLEPLGHHRRARQGRGGAAEPALPCRAMQGNSRWRRPGGALRTWTSWRSTRRSRGSRSTPRASSAWTPK